MDVQARLKPIKQYPWLAMVLAAWEPPDQPKYFRVVCGQVVETRAGPRPCPQELGTVAETVSTRLFGAPVSCDRSSGDPPHAGSITAWGLLSRPCGHRGARSER